MSYDPTNPQDPPTLPAGTKARAMKAPTVDDDDTPETCAVCGKRIGVTSRGVVLPDGTFLQFCTLGCYLSMEVNLIKECTLRDALVSGELPE